VVVDVLKHLKVLKVQAQVFESSIYQLKST